MKELNIPNPKVENTDGNEADSNILNTADNDGHTALHLACLNGHFQVVSYLYTCGANLETWYVRSYSSYVI